MPWRMIGFLFFLTLFIIFSGFNTHLIQINIGPIKLMDVPMFIALFIAFLMGAVVTLPFTLLSISKKKKLKAEKEKNKQESKEKQQELPDNKNKKSKKEKAIEEE